MITEKIVSVKWATAVSQFDIKSPEDLDLLSQFKDWYTKADSIEEVPQPFKGWVENGLPAKHKRK